MISLAFAVLGNRGDPRAVDPVAGLIGAIPNVCVAAGAQRSLAGTGDTRTIALLEALREHFAFTIRKASLDLAGAGGLAP